MKKLHVQIVLCAILLINSLHMHAMMARLKNWYKASTHPREMVERQQRPSRVSLFRSYGSSIVSADKPTGSWIGSVSSYFPGTEASDAKDKYNRMLNNIKKQKIPTFSEVDSFWQSAKASGYRADLNVLLSEAMKIFIKKWENGWVSNDDLESLRNDLFNLQAIYRIHGHLDFDAKQDVKLFILKTNEKLTDNDSFKHLRSIAALYADLAVFLGDDTLGINVDFKRAENFLYLNIAEMASYSLKQLVSDLKNNTIPQIFEKDKELIMNKFLDCGIIFDEKNHIVSFTTKNQQFTYYFGAAEDQLATQDIWSQLININTRAEQGKLRELLLDNLSDVYIDMIFKNINNMQFESDNRRKFFNLFSSLLDQSNYNEMLNKKASWEELCKNASFVRSDKIVAYKNYVNEKLQEEVIKKYTAEQQKE